MQTKGLSLEQIDLMYQNTTPVKSLEYRRRLIAEGPDAVHGTTEKYHETAIDEKDKA